MARSKTHEKKHLSLLGKAVRSVNAQMKAVFYEKYFDTQKEVEDLKNKFTKQADAYLKKHSELSGGHKFDVFLMTIGMRFGILQQGVLV